MDLKGTANIYRAYKQALMSLPVSKYKRKCQEIVNIKERSDKVKFAGKILDEQGLMDRSRKSLKIPKDDKLSDEFRIQGNKLYAKSDYIAAVEKYNESLCYAESKLNLALAYANRSAVCFELEMYSTCLQNIDLAKSNDYPAEKISRLDERAEKCNRLIAEGAETDENMLKPSGEEHLKLSHPPHPKLPYISDCLDVKFNDEFGRHIVTNKRLLPGEIVCIESPFSVSLHLSRKYHHCINCIENSFLSLIPCHLSASAMFCSQKCKDEAFESYFEYKVDVMDELHRIYPQDKTDADLAAVDMFFKALKTCGGDLQLLKSIVEENDNNPEMNILTVKNPSDPIDILRAIEAFETHEKNHSTDMMLMISGTIAIIVDLFLRYSYLMEILRTEDDVDIFRSFLYKHALLEIVNSYSFGATVKSTKEMYDENGDEDIYETPAKSVSRGIFPFLTMINHSCCPNVFRNYDHSKMFLIVQRVIEPGEQLCDSYCSNFKFDDYQFRQNELRKQYYFECKCEACVKKWPIADYLPLKFRDDKKNMVKLLEIYELMHNGFNLVRAEKAQMMLRKFLLEKNSLYPCCEIVDMQYYLIKCYMIFLMSKLALKLVNADSK